VATIAAPMGPAHAAGLISSGERERIERDGEAEVSLGGRVFRLRREFLEDISSHSLNEAVGRLGAALLVLHSPLDQRADAARSSGSDPDRPGLTRRRAGGGGMGIVPQGVPRGR